MIRVRQDRKITILPKLKGFTITDIHLSRIWTRENGTLQRARLITKEFKKDSYCSRNITRTCGTRLMKWFINKWDTWIYNEFRKSLKRMVKDKGWLIYLLELEIQDVRSKHPIPESLEGSTRHFFVAMKELNKR